MLELLAVIAIILLLAGLVVGLSSLASRRSFESRAKAEIRAMELALRMYKEDFGIYPQSPTASDALKNSKMLFRALSSNSAGTSLLPDSGKRAYFTAFREGKNANAVRDVDNKYFLADPNGLPYNYVCGFSSVQTNKVTFDLWSYGVDGATGTADDIANWGF